MTSNKNAYEDIIQTLGFEAVKKLSEKFGGMSIYIPQLKRLMKMVCRVCLYRRPASVLLRTFRSDTC